MKKKYIAPQSTEVTLFTESLMMSNSNIDMGVDSGKETPDSWSNKQGWSSENWSESEEEI